ncbi:MAG: hypothetical protein QM724_12790 [Flavobacteriales bacterium]
MIRSPDIRDQFIVRAALHHVAGVHQGHAPRPEGTRLQALPKDGELADEVLPVRQPVCVHELSSYFSEEFFATKKVVELWPVMLRLRSA